MKYPYSSEENCSLSANDSYELMLEKKDAEIFELKWNVKALNEAAKTLYYRMATQQTIQVISFFTLHNCFYIIIFFCEHIKVFYKTITSFCLLGK